jgi:glycosyltransferase involved in cell wall biosynthesis
MVRWLDPLWWLTAARASAVVAINEETAGHLPLRWIAGDRISVEPAVAVDSMPASGTVSSHDGRHILYVGRHLPVKGGALAVEAFARIAQGIPQARLTLIGEGPEEKNLRRRVHELGIEPQVEFRPWQTQERVWRAMETADVFLFPSMEGAGMVVLEAMRAGLPVVCLKFGGPGTMVTDETGFRVPTGTSDRVIEELGAALVRLLEDPALRARMSGAAQQRAIENFSWKAKRAFVRSIYRDILVNRLPGTVGQMMLDRGHRGD